MSDLAHRQAFHYLIKQPRTIIMEIPGWGVYYA